MNIRILVNNEPTTTAASNVSQLAEELALPERGVAVAVNNCVIQRSLWTQTILNDGDSVTVIKAAFGG